MKSTRKKSKRKKTPAALRKSTPAYRAVKRKAGNAGAGRGKRLDDSIRAVLDVIVASLDNEAARRVFRDRVQRVDVSITLGEAVVDVKITGAEIPPAAWRASAAPESCREVFKMALASAAAGEDLKEGEKVPNKKETDVSGPIKKKIKRTDSEFASLVENNNAKIVFKDEEDSGADRMMSSALRDRLNALADLVEGEWAGFKLRVTEAWDEDNEHAGNSLHYEGRAADLTTHPIDGSKLGRLGRLAVDAGCDWVWYENSAHIHVSVSA